MADPRFFDRAGPFTLESLAALSGARLLHPQDGARLFRDVGPLETAGPEDVSFLENRKYLQMFVRSRGGAAFVEEQVAGRAPPGMAVLVSNEPYRAYALAAQAFYPARPIIPRRAPSVGIDPTAIVPEDCDVGPNTVIEQDARLGRRCRVGANTVIAAGVEVGDDCQIGPNVTLSHCVVGSRVVLHPGVRIGQEGVGFAPDPAGPLKVPHLGRG